MRVRREEGGGGLGGRGGRVRREVSSYLQHLLCCGSLARVLGQRQFHKTVHGS